MEFHQNGLLQRILIHRRILTHMFHIVAVKDMFIKPWSKMTKNVTFDFAPTLQGFQIILKIYI